MNGEAKIDTAYWEAQGLLRKGNPKHALERCKFDFGIYCKSLETLILTGEIYLCFDDALELEETTALQLAFDYFNEAIEIELRHSAAWAGKALSLVYLNRTELSLKAVKNGFAYLVSSNEVSSNFPKSLHQCKILGLLELRNQNEPRIALKRVLEAIPKSQYDPAYQEIR